LKRLWLDLGDLGVYVRPAGAHDRWQDHGMGLLRTILRDSGVETDMFSLRSLLSWKDLGQRLAAYDMLVMNVRSYTYPFAYKAAKTFKQVNPKGLVVTGGMHATVAPDEMEAVREFDHICQGPGENVIGELLKDPAAFPRMVLGTGAKSLADWPMIDRTLWPDPDLSDFPWPLEPECGWGPGPVATVITSRVCPWQCVFCNEASFIPNMGRRPVEAVIEELNYLDDQYGPLGSVVIHDSMFFQQPTWLREWVDKYPRLAHRPWPYWAAARSDTVRQWPDLFEALIRETNWNLISIGFESGSDRVLKILNKECTAEDNLIAIDHLNRIGDDMEQMGKEPPKFWANIMLGIPGETHEDAFETIRMLKRMKRVMPSISYYAPYPGSALGYQLIAEGKSLMSKENYHRYPKDEKVKGIDYRFYNRLLAGKYDREINMGLPEYVRGKTGVFEDSLIKA
jgi:radical SAM superfamily enzyme YgiQ (UPF0313 family)